MKFIETIKNIWKIPELRRRILFTLGLIFVYRFGSWIVLPGVDPLVLENVAKNSSNSNSLLGLINMFTGGAFNKGAIFALGIMPYITASIIIQLLGFAVPYFQKLQQKEGESGRKKLTQITRFLTVAITLVQGGSYLAYLKSMGAVDGSVPDFVFWLSNIIVLSTGVIFAMWLGEKITDKGIGNGISLLITIGIIARLPAVFGFEFTSKLQTGSLLSFALEIVFLFVAILATVLIVTGIRKIPVQYPKRMVGRGATAMPAAGNRDYIPVKVNAAGVMPIIFAQAIMFLPAAMIGYFVGADSGINSSYLLRSLNDYTSIPYNVIYFFIIVIFTYIYTALMVNPTNYADYLKRQNAFIPGIKPGKATADFIDAVTSRITLPGAIFLALIAITPAFARAFGINSGFARFFGGTSIIILVGVVLDTLQQIESYLLMRRYDGLVKSGKIQGRSSRLQGIGSNM